MVNRRLAGVSAVSLVAAAVLLVAAPASTPATTVTYSFSGRLLTTPVAGANSLALRIDTGNAAALAKLGTQDRNQALAVGSGTGYFRWANGVRSAGSVRDLRAGYWLRIDVRAADSASLAQIRATAAAAVHSYGVWDTTPPLVTPLVTGPAGANGWYRGDAVVQWGVSDPESGVVSSAGCAPVTLTQETGGVNLTCSARNAVYLLGSGRVTVSIDKTPPAVGAAPSRPPDQNGFYNHPVTIAFSGTDVTSGIGACTSAEYRGPDGPAVVVPGSCTDHAGNSATASFALVYDATPPARVRGFRAQSANHAATLTWQRPRDADFERVIITRVRLGGRAQAAERAIYDGAAGRHTDIRLANDVRYRYVATALDRAGNRSAPAVAAVVPQAILLVAPRAAARISRPPLLRWVPYRAPRYYNVQLYRGGRKILSAWPARARFALRASWTHAGRRYRLVPGRYRWFVWPGYGPRTRAQYGQLLGGSTFTVVARRR